MNWKAVAIATWIVILVAGAFAAGAVVSGRLHSGAATPSIPKASPAVIPTPVPTPSPSPASPPSPSPLPDPARFATLTTDWQGCFHTEHPQQPPICLGHGVFKNVGGSAGSTGITFAVPDGSASCTTATAVVPPQSETQASCDLGFAGENYWGVHSGGPGTAPVATVSNP